MRKQIGSSKISALFFCLYQIYCLSLQRNQNYNNMNKFYTIDFEVEYCADNCMEGTFNEKTVIKEVEEFLKARYGDRLKWFVIKDADEDCVYDSQNIITTI